MGLLIGPAGSKQRELVAASGGDVKISIRGKGSKGSESLVPGMPEVGSLLAVCFALVSVRCLFYSLIFTNTVIHTIHIFM